MLLWITLNEDWLNQKWNYDLFSVCHIYYLRFSILFHFPFMQVFQAMFLDESWTCKFVGLASFWKSSQILKAGKLSWHSHNLISFLRWVNRWHTSDYLLLEHRYFTIIKLLSFYKILKYTRPSVCIISFIDQNIIMMEE